MTTSRNARMRGQLASTLRAIGGRALVVVAGAFIGVLLAVINIQVTAKTYEATAQVFVTVSSVSDASQLYNGDQFTLSRVQSYINLVDSPDITGPVSDELGNQLSERQIADRVSADAPLNKVLINIHARDGSASRAARIANLAATQFITTVQRIETAQRSAQSQSTQSPVKLTVTHPADAPQSPVAPQRKLLLLAGFLGGAVLGLLIVVVRDRLLRRVRTPRDVEALLATPPLGVVPKDRRSERQPNAFVSSQSPRAEAFRQLRTNLQFVDVDNPPKIIAVTSPLGGEGKTSVALNLSVALAEARVSVVLVETDLRQPVLADLLDLDDEVGLTSVLIGSATIDEAIQHDGRGMSVITSGPKPFNPSELLGSQQARSAIADIAERFEYVILDAVSMLPLADGAETALLAHTTVLVSRAGRTSPDNIRASIGNIKRVGGTFGGVVLNGASGSRWVAPDRRPKASASRVRTARTRVSPPDDDDGLEIVTTDTDADGLEYVAAVEPQELEQPDEHGPEVEPNAFDDTDVTADVPDTADEVEASDVVSPQRTRSRNSRSRRRSRTAEPAPELFTESDAATESESSVDELQSEEAVDPQDDDAPATESDLESDVESDLESAAAQEPADQPADAALPAEAETDAETVMDAETETDDGEGVPSTDGALVSQAGSGSPAAERVPRKTGGRKVGKQSRGTRARAQRSRPNDRS